MDVDEARSHERAVGVDRSVRPARHLTDLHDPISVDRDVAGEARTSGAVDDGSAADNEIMGHADNVALSSLGAYGDSSGECCRSE